MKKLLLIGIVFFLSICSLSSNDSKSSSIEDILNNPWTAFWSGTGLDSEDRYWSVVSEVMSYEEALYFKQRADKEPIMKAIDFKSQVYPSNQYEGNYRVLVASGLDRKEAELLQSNNSDHLLRHHPKLNRYLKPQ